LKAIKSFVSGTTGNDFTTFNYQVKWIEMTYFTLQQSLTPKELLIIILLYLTTIRPDISYVIYLVQ